MERRVRAQGQDHVVGDPGNDGPSGKCETEKTGHEESDRVLRDAYQQRVVVHTYRVFSGIIWLIHLCPRNLIALLVLNGEPAWLCLICCKTDSMLHRPSIITHSEPRRSRSSSSSRQRVGCLLDYLDQGLLRLGQVAGDLDGTAVPNLQTHHCTSKPAGIRRPRYLAAPGSCMGAEYPPHRPIYQRHP